jgi:hypothetical protein
VVSILPVEVDDDVDSLKMVVTVVDWRVLRQADGSMYDKVFAVARRMGTRLDNALLAHLYQQQEREQPREEDERKARRTLTPRQLEGREEAEEEWRATAAAGSGSAGSGAVSAGAAIDRLVDMPAIHLKLGKISVRLYQKNCHFW